jgi:DNA-binding transcriptional LysR family regulator
VELRDIEYFGVIAQHGNMRRAAEALGLSPPALSKSLRRLETSMEARLVERTGRGVRLTPMGNALAAQAQRLRLTLEDITREAADLNHGRAGYLRIGAGPTDCEMLPAALRRLMKEAPRLRIDITISDNDELVPLILAGNLDLALNTVPPAGYEGIEQVHVLDDEYAAFASASHPFARRRRISLGDLLKEHWTSSTADYRPKQILVQAFSDHGLPVPRFVLQSRSVRLRLQMVSASALLGFGPRRAVEQAAAALRLKVLPVDELTHPRAVGVMYRKGAYLPPAAKRLIELLKACA